MSDTVDAFDPSAPEGDVSRGGHYVSARDFRKLILLFAGALLAFIPVYQIMKGNTDKSRCTQNMKSIFEAINQYATEHDGRFPPIARTEQIGGIVPGLGDTGSVYTWASDVSGYMSSRASFLCPSAQKDEIVQTEDPRTAGKTLPLTYGMYEPYGGFLTTLVENPDQLIIVAETSNRGSRETFDPLPFTSSTGQALPDGFEVGWSDSNSDDTKTTNVMTRLAFPGTDKGVFKKDGGGRHMNMIHALTATGNLLHITPVDAFFHDATGLRASTSWTVPGDWELHSH